jgi:hypothetical protein
MKLLIPHKNHIHLLSFPSEEYSNFTAAAAPLHIPIDEREHSAKIYLDIAPPAAVMGQKGQSFSLRLVTNNDGQLPRNLFVYFPRREATLFHPGKMRARPTKSEAISN